MIPAPTAYSCARAISPSSTIEALAVVPPMSKVMIFARSFARASACAPTTPPAGPDFDDVHRPFGGGRVGRQPAVRLHQQQARRNAGAVEPLAQRAQIGRDDRHHIGVDDRGRGALVFLDLGQHDLERDAQRQARRLARDRLLQHRLVHRIGERVDQAHRDRLDLLGQQRVDGAFGVGGVERTLDAATVVDALVDHLAQIALDQRRRLGPGEVVELRHPQGADLQHVAEALGGDQPDARALVLQDGVGGDRGAVANLLDRGAAQAGLGENLAQAVDDRLRVVVDARRDLLGVSWCGSCRRSRAARCR